jgi:hypothetical protein
MIPRMTAARKANETMVMIVVTVVVVCIERLLSGKLALSYDLSDRDKEQ